ncbi:MAG: protein-glutamate O-methyltransferase CheR [Gemmatimonadales bacterium]|nr:protein-glutamate O-methyltransferase CheR [Gemmatimonadales bacterium]
MPIGTAEFNYIRDLVRQQSAIVIEPGKEYLVESRLASLARGEGFASVEQFIAQLRSRPQNGLHRRVIDAMTTNETSFFRDVHPFDALRQVVIPELAARRQAEKTLTIWCGACSSGQEPYTIAMVLRELGHPFPGWTVRVVATDLSTEMLERAKGGRYSQLEVNRGLPAAFLVKYFQKTGAEWSVKDELRKLIDFRPINLAEPWAGMPSCDIVFMRNVLIYFDVPTKRDILGRVRRLLRPDGYLFLGGAETTLNLDDSYRRAPVGKAVAYRPPEA